MNPEIHKREAKEVSTMSDKKLCSWPLLQSSSPGGAARGTSLVDDLICLPILGVSAQWRTWVTK
jgi:hypothetical protein